MADTLMVVAAVLVAIVSLLHWARHEFEEGSDAGAYANRKYYHLLERVRDQLFRGSRDVRLTVFEPDPQTPDEIRPVARLGWGRSAANSPVRFKKGKGLAGIAWETKYSFLVAEFVGVGDVESTREAHKRLFNLDADAAAALSEKQLAAKVLLAVSLVDAGRFRGVLTIDCRKEDLVPKPDTNPGFWEELVERTIELTRMVAPTQTKVLAPEPVREYSGASITKVAFDSYTGETRIPLETAR